MSDISSLHFPFLKLWMLGIVLLTSATTYADSDLVICLPHIEGTYGPTFERFSFDKQHYFIYSRS